MIRIYSKSKQLENLHVCYIFVPQRISLIDRFEHSKISIITISLHVIILMEQTTTSHLSVLFGHVYSKPQQITRLHITAFYKLIWWI